MCSCIGIKISYKGKENHKNKRFKIMNVSRMMASIAEYMNIKYLRHVIVRVSCFDPQYLIINGIKII